MQLALLDPIYTATDHFLIRNKSDPQQRRLGLKASLT